MDNQDTVRELKRKRVVLLEELGRIGPLIVGSLAEVGVKCGNPTCRCAKGERHTAYVLTGKTEGRTRTLHVPRGMVEEVGTWVKEHRRLKALVREISALSEQIVRLHVRASRDARETKRRPNRRQPKRSSRA